MEHYILLILYFFLDLVFIGISIPLLYKKIPRNKYYGFRTDRTLSNDKIWYDANTYFAKHFIIFNLFQVITTIGNYFIFANEKQYLLAENLILIVGITIVIVLSFIHLKKISS